MSPRNITSTIRTHTKSATVRPFYMCEIQLDSGTLRVNNSYKNLSWDGETWNGVGDAGGISGVKEASDLSATGITLMLSGIGSDYWNEAMTADYSGRTVIIYAAFFDEDLNILADPITIFEGVCDQMNLITGNMATIEVSIETDMLRWRIPKEHRWTNADQQLRFPSDKGFEFVAQVMEKEILWGGSGVAPIQGGSLAQAWGVQAGVTVIPYRGDGGDVAPAPDNNDYAAGGGP